MITNSEPLCLAEVNAQISKESNPHLYDFLGKFHLLNIKETLKFKEEILGLNILGLDLSLLTKILDFLPADKEDLQKILVNLSLSEEESAKVLEIVKKYK